MPSRTEDPEEGRNLTLGDKVLFLDKSYPEFSHLLEQKLLNRLRKQSAKPFKFSCRVSPPPRSKFITFFGEGKVVGGYL